MSTNTMYSLDLWLVRGGVLLAALAMFFGCAANVLYACGYSVNLRGNRVMLRGLLSGAVIAGSGGLMAGATDLGGLVRG